VWSSLIKQKAPCSVNYVPKLHGWQGINTIKKIGLAFVIPDRFSHKFSSQSSIFT
jgi:hypothetical protein